MRTLLVLALFVSSSFLGCRGHASAATQGPGLNARREAKLLELASQELQCPAASLSAAFIESIEKNAHVYRVTGCEKTYESILACVMGNCVWNETPEKRASFDLQCPREQLTRTYLGNATFGMAGCGRTITYLFVNGRLVANSATSTINTPAPAAP